MFKLEFGWWWVVWRIDLRVEDAVFCETGGCCVEGAEVGWLEFGDFDEEHCSGYGYSCHYWRLMGWR